MSNKPKNNVSSVNSHIQARQLSKQDQVIADARAAQEAKQAAAKEAEAAKAKADLEGGTAAPEAKEPDAKEPEASKTEDKSKDTKVKHVYDRKTKAEWKAIISEMLNDGLEPATVSKRYNVSRGSIYKYKSELAAELAKDAEKEEAAKLTPLSHAENTQKLLESVDAQLADFDAKVAEAQAIVDSAAEQRKIIENSKADYQQILDLLAKQEAVAKALKAKSEAVAEDAKEEEVSKK